MHKFSDNSFKFFKLSKLFTSTFARLLWHIDKIRNEFELLNKFLSVNFQNECRKPTVSYRNCLILFAVLIP